jgi:hypothetical protein
VEADGTLTDVTMFVPDATSVVDMAVSPAGCLTWVSIGGLGVREVCFAGGANEQPHALATANPRSGLAPLAVQFDGTGSSDPDQDLLSYNWAFGDSTMSAAAAPMKTYSTNGTPGGPHRRRRDRDLERDRHGGGDPHRRREPLPDRGHHQPAPGAPLQRGRHDRLCGTATDPEDGTLPASGFSWKVVFHHAEHTHPFLGPIGGVKSGTFVVPTTGEDATNVFYRISLTATDSGAPLGATGTVAHES